MLRNNQPSRRKFFQKTAVLGAGLAIPYFVPAHVLSAPGRVGANDRIHIGWIGTGRRVHQMLADLRSAPSIPGECKIVAVADVWPKKCHDYLQALEEKVLVRKGEKAGAKCEIYQDYRELLDQKGIDGVVLSTPEHSRALPCILACQAGKDVYAEKPLSLTIREGRMMVEAVRKYERVCQVGTQQRSHFRNREASELVLNGRLGKLEAVLCQNLLGSRPYSDYKIPIEPMPQDMDWDHWCGQTEPVPFSTHVYRTYHDPGWHVLRRYSGGDMANLGSHALDNVQWALGKDHTGPVEVESHGNRFDSEVTFRYKDGLLLKMTNEVGDKVTSFGAIFVGERGRLVMHRGRFNTIPIAISQEPIREGDKRLYKSDHHFQNWIDCIKSRERPVADVESGHRACTIVHLANLARALGRKLAWDTVREAFPNDEEANTYLSRSQRKPYQLPEIV